MTITDAEYKFCSYQIGQLGSFYTLLIQTMLQADDKNLEKLKLGFPELADVIYAYHNDGKGYSIPMIVNNSVIVKQFIYDNTKS